MSEPKSNKDPKGLIAEATKHIATVRSLIKTLTPKNGGKADDEIIAVLDMLRYTNTIIGQHRRNLRHVDDIVSRAHESKSK